MIPTAAHFINSTSYNSLLEQKEAMIEFAKPHVTEALKRASEKAEVVDQAYHDVEIDTDSIINAYPLSNIK